MDPRHHHHHHRHDDEEVEDRYDEQGPPPPPQSAFPPPIQRFPNQINPNFGYAAPPPAYPPVHHLSHEIDPGFNQYAPSYPPHHVQHLSHELSPDYAPNSYPPPPPHVHHLSHELSPDYAPNSYPPPVQHLSHEINQPPPQPSDHHHHYQPHLPSFVHHHTHEAGSDLSNKPTVRVYCKAETAYSLTVRDGKVILSRSDPNDVFQHWIKDEKYSTRVKDEEGFPSFALVNKATGQAMKHSIGATHPVQLIPYNPDTLDESILWAESKDLGDGYRTIRMVNNIRLNLDAFNGDKNHGGVHEGTIAVLWEWKKGDNQRWKIAPY